MKQRGETGNKGRYDRGEEKVKQDKRRVTIVSKYRKKVKTIVGQWKEKADRRSFTATAKDLVLVATAVLSPVSIVK